MIILNIHVTLKQNAYICDNMIFLSERSILYIF